MSSDKYQPYVKDTRENANDIRENSGAGATEPYIPNGWQPGLDKKTEDGQ